MSKLSDLNFQPILNVEGKHYLMQLTPIDEDAPIKEDESTKVPFTLRGNIQIIEKTKKDRIIAGYANVAVVDQEEQFIPIETLEKGMKSLLDDPHYSNLMLVHKNIQIGKIIESYGDYETKVDDKGLFIVAEIRQDIKTADEIWNSILDKELNGFSIGCEVLLSHEECDDEKCIVVLDEINIFEVSVCSEPVNQKSGFIIISKSKFDDVCNECETKLNKMVKKKNKSNEESEEAKEKSEDQEVEEEEKTEETKEESKPEEQEKSEDNPVLEKLAELERQIEAIQGVIQQMAKKPEDEEEMPEEEEEPVEEPEEEKKKSEDEPPKQEEEKSKEKPVETPNKAIEELKSTMETLIGKLSILEEKKAIEELELSIKARDDQIEALKKKIEIKEKSKKPEEKPEPKTIEEDKETELEYDSPIRVEKGIVYYEE